MDRTKIQKSGIAASFSVPFWRHMVLCFCLVRHIPLIVTADYFLFIYKCCYPTAEACTWLWSAEELTLALILHDFSSRTYQLVRMSVWYSLGNLIGGARPLDWFPLDKEPSAGLMSSGWMRIGVGWGRTECNPLKSPWVG